MLKFLVFAVSFLGEMEISICTVGQTAASRQVRGDDPAAVAFAPFQPGGMRRVVMGSEEMPWCQALLQNINVVPHPY